jgi:hypothetical protein
MPTRRAFLRATALSAAGMVLGSEPGQAAEPLERLDGGWMTVTGFTRNLPAPVILPHEHVTTDFLGAERLPAPRYDRGRPSTRSRRISRSCVNGVWECWWNARPRTSVAMCSC